MFILSVVFSLFLQPVEEMCDGRDQREAAPVSTAEISRHPLKLWMPHREGNSSEYIYLYLSLSLYKNMASLVPEIWILRFNKITTLIL